MAVPVPFGQYVAGLAGPPARAAREDRLAAAYTLLLFSSMELVPGLAGLGACGRCRGGARRGRPVLLAATAVSDPSRGSSRSRSLISLRCIPAQRTMPAAGSDRSASTPSGLMPGLFFASRIVLLVMGTSLLTLTTSPVRLDRCAGAPDAPALGRPLPGRRGRHDALSIALRFMPTTAEEAERIVVAQTARGARFDRRWTARAGASIRSGARAAVREICSAGPTILQRPWSRGAIVARSRTRLRAPRMSVDRLVWRWRGCVHSRRSAAILLCRGVVCRMETSADHRGASRIALTVAYDGAPFAGFARQPGLDTVQGRLEKALAHRAATRGRDGRRRPDRCRRARARPGRQLRRRRRPSPSRRAAPLSQRAHGRGHRRDATSAEREQASRRASTRRLASTATASWPGPVPPLFLGAGSPGRRAGRSTCPPCGGGAAASSASTTSARSACRSRPRTRRTIRRDRRSSRSREEEHLGETCLTVRVVGNAFLHSMVRVDRRVRWSSRCAGVESRVGGGGA